MVQLISRRSSGLSIVETEQPAEALTPLNVGARADRGWCPSQKLVVEALVVSLAMVVLDVLSDNAAEVPLAERDNPIETLLPRAVRLRVDPGDGHTAGLQLDHEEDEVPPETGQREHLGRE